MLAPTIHLNGSHGPYLLEEYQTAADALAAAIDAVQSITVNARDYYPQGPDAFPAASKRRAEMLAQMHALREEVCDAMLSVSDAIDARS